MSEERRNLVSEEAYRAATGHRVLTPEDLRDLTSGRDYMIFLAVFSPDLNTGNTVVQLLADQNLNHVPTTLILQVTADMQKALASLSKNILEEISQRE